MKIKGVKKSNLEKKNIKIKQTYKWRRLRKNAADSFCVVKSVEKPRDFGSEKCEKVSGFFNIYKENEGKPLT